MNSNTNSNLNTHRASGMPDIGSTGGKLAITTTNIEVYANGMKIGFVQSLTPSETRNIVKVQELGTEGVVQSVPSNTQGGQLAITRFAVYNGNLFNALGATRSGQFVKTEDFDNFQSKPEPKLSHSNPFKTLKDQRVPLEFKVQTKMPTGGYYHETYIDCWLASYSKTIAANTITITESATIQYSDVVAGFAKE
mgnify:CR=1 FL=1